jgi:hypothetical protein
MKAAASACIYSVLVAGLLSLLSCGGRDAIDDECPFDANKDRPGACGCGVLDDDADGNGVPDCFDDRLDLCPDDPSKTLPGACGCGVSDRDFDANGVPDCFDAAFDLCPDDPDKREPGICGCGFVDDDFDDNGVPDCFDSAIDLCPDDASKTVPGTCGCGLADDDANANGVPDCLDPNLDLCPDDSSKTLPGACGCGIADDDANANGVPDCLDAQIDLCPDDRDKIVPGTCGCGLSDDDANGNGVPDCIDGGFDLCPGDPDKTLPGVCGCGVPDTDFDDNALPDCLVPPGDGEPWNNEIDGAEPLTPGVPVVAYIWYPGDRDWYAIEATAGQTIRVQYQTDQNPTEPYLRLEDPDGNRIWALSASVEQGDTSIDSGNRGAVTTGTYHVRIEDREGDDFSDTVPYVLTVLVEDSPDPGEPDNNTEAGAVVIAPGTPTDGYIGHVEDEDWFQFDVVAGQQVQVTLDQAQAPWDPSIELYNPSGNAVWSDEGTGGLGPITLDSGLMTMGYGGTYLLHVLDVDSNEWSVTVPYTLTVTVVTP